MTRTHAAVGGFVAPGFEAVATEFERNFEERGELGAAFAAVRAGELVVDLWGGTADRAEGRPWDGDTVLGIFSGGKGLVATCLLILIERGLLELDAPVARYWPEFAAAGKADIRVRNVVSHTAGLPGLGEPLDEDDLIDDRRLAALLAAQAPLDPPGSSLCYHGLTYGWLCGELVRRIDGRSVGRFFAEEVAWPLKLEAWIGLPAELEPRVATLELDPAWRDPAEVSDPEFVELARAVRENPPIISTRMFPWNRRDFRAAEIPGANAVASARSVARLYASLACGGEIDGIRLLQPRTITAGTQELSRGYEPLLARQMAFATGFALQANPDEFGPPADAFGHGGAGGSSHGAWPSHATGFSYAMNLMRNAPDGDGRSDALLRALYAALQSTD